jgi:homoserine/homoserine lactone efflux protein
MQFSTWLTYLIAAIAISLSPGPGAIAAMGAGLNHGFRHGRRIALGLAAGVATQLLVVGVGLGALMATSEMAFSIVKWVGAAYLVWLGIQQWRAQARPLGVDTSTPNTDRPTAPTAHDMRALMLRGWTVNALNPKGTVFLLAVMPQFLDLSRPLLAQYATIGLTTAVIEFTVMTGYVAVASRVLALLRQPKHIRWMNRSFGSLFMAAGAFLASFKHTV